MKKTKGTILVVEDSRSLLILYKKSFHAAGFKVLGFDKSIDALLALRSQMVDLVLTDLMLPDMNGTDLIPHLSLHTDLPVMVVSAYGQYKETLMREEPSIKAFFEKPVAMKKLVKTIEQILVKKPVKGIGKQSGKNGAG